jgi:hypothetical protein
MLTACGGGSNAKVTKENFDKLTNKMEKAEVIKISLATRRRPRTRRHKV